MGESDSAGIRKRGTTRFMANFPFPGQRPHREEWNAGAGKWDTVRDAQYIFDNLITWLRKNNALTYTYDDTVAASFMHGRSTYKWGGGSYWPAPDSGQASFITYDDTVSIREKVRWAKSLGMGGVGFYEVFSTWVAHDTADRLMPLIRVVMNEVGTTGGWSEPSKIWYVSPTGSDSNPGTIEAPFLTLKKVFGDPNGWSSGVISDGDTVYLRTGTYLLDSTFRVSKNRILLTTYPRKFPRTPS